MTETTVPYQSGLIVDCAGCTLAPTRNFELGAGGSLGAGPRSARPGSAVTVRVTTTSTVRVAVATPGVVVAGAGATVVVAAPNPFAWARSSPREPRSGARLMASTTVAARRPTTATAPP